MEHAIQCSMTEKSFDDIMLRESEHLWYITINDMNSEILQKFIQRMKKINNTLINNTLIIGIYKT